MSARVRYTALYPLLFAATRVLYVAAQNPGQFAAAPQDGPVVRGVVGDRPHAIGVLDDAVHPADQAVRIGIEHELRCPVDGRTADPGAARTQLVGGPVAVR